MALHPRKHRPDDELELVHRLLRLVRNDDEERPSQRHGEGSQHLHLLAERRHPRLRDVPLELHERAQEGRRRAALLVTSRRKRLALQPRRHRHARSRPLDGALPHVPGRLHRRRLCERHAGRVVGSLRLPDRSQHLQRHRKRPDHELHGLHRRLVHVPVHGRPGLAHGRAVHDLPLRQIKSQPRARCALPGRAPSRPLFFSALTNAALEEASCRRRPESST